MKVTVPNSDVVEIHLATVIELGAYHNTITIVDQDWSGIYECQVRKRGEVLGTMAVTAELVGADTVFTLDLEADHQIPASHPTSPHDIDIRSTDGVVRFTGTVDVKQAVTKP